MEELSVGVPLDQVSDPRALPDQVSLYRRKAQGTELSFPPERKLMWRQSSDVLRCIKSEKQSPSRLPIAGEPRLPT